MTTEIGYARVSSTGQKLEVQLDKLEGCSRVFQEKASGTTNTRPVLQECLRYLRAGDTLVITKLDRLARSTHHLTQITHDLDERGIDLKVLDQAIDTSTPTGKLLFNVLASIAEFETAIRAERQAEGIKKALENGVKFGAKAKLTQQQIDNLRTKRESGTKVKELMAEYGISKATFYRLLSSELVRVNPGHSRRRANP